MVLLASCVSKKLPISQFTPLADSIKFNGTYSNIDGKLSLLFNLSADIADFITIEYNPQNRNQLKLSYDTESGVKHIYIKGKLKNNFFEIYFKNKRIFIPILYTVFNVDRIRIGSSTEDDLSIYSWFENWGMVLFFAGGGKSDEYEFNFQKFGVSKHSHLIPYHKNNKWGFIDSTHQIVIEPQYDFVRAFKNDVARVKSNGKWGLINMQGETVSPCKYDTICPRKEDLFLVMLNSVCP